VTTPPSARPPAPAAPPQYVGFWLRVWATVIDSIWVLLLLTPLAAVVGEESTLSLDELLGDPSQLSAGALLGQLLPSGRELLLWVALPALMVLAFWDRKLATPGKMAIHAKIVDAASGGPPSRRQLLVRYLGYLLATLPLGLGLLWVGIDPRKQGWHDKLAGTAVIRTRRAA
jgi:uncharacterized RDD family membrane protein YckC